MSELPYSPWHDGNAAKMSGRVTKSKYVETKTKPVVKKNVRALRKKQ